jgi:hypothetical protein
MAHSFATHKLLNFKGSVKTAQLLSTVIKNDVLTDEVPY